MIGGLCACEKKWRIKRCSINFVSSAQSKRLMKSSWRTFRGVSHSDGSWTAPQRRRRGSDTHRRTRHKRTLPGGRCARAVTAKSHEKPRLLSSVFVCAPSWCLAMQGWSSSNQRTEQQWAVKAAEHGAELAKRRQLTAKRAHSTRGTLPRSPLWAAHYGGGFFSVRTWTFLLFFPPVRSVSF